MFLTLAVIMSLLFGGMAYMIYVLMREREHSFKWKVALERSIYDAGWIEEYKRACEVASDSLTTHLRE